MSLLELEKQIYNFSTDDSFQNLNILFKNTRFVDLSRTQYVSNKNN